MTQAGKKLQDVYDLGASQLTKLEVDSRQRLKEASKNTAQERSKDEDNWQVRFEGKSSELEGELKSWQENCMERLKKIADQQTTETTNHLNASIRDLETLADRLKKSIKGLTLTHKENVEQLSQSLVDQLESSLEYHSADLSKQEFGARTQLRSHGTAITNSLQHNLDQSLWESRGEEKQVNSLLFKSFMQKANSIDTHFSTLMQEVSSDFHSQFRSLEGHSQKGEAELHVEMQALSQQVESQAHQLEIENEAFFQNKLNEHAVNLDKDLNDKTQALSKVHDRTTNELSERTKVLTNELGVASTEARDAMNHRCLALGEKVDRMFADFSARLEERIKRSRNLKDNLEEEKNTVFTTLRSALTELAGSFETRLASLVEETVTKVQKASSQAETEISSVSSRCLLELKNVGSKTRSEIESSIKKCAEMVVEQRTKALEAIQLSVNQTHESSTPEAKPPEERRRRRRNTENGPQAPQI